MFLLKKYFFFTIWVCASSLLCEHIKMYCYWKKNLQELSFTVIEMHLSSSVFTGIKTHTCKVKCTVSKQLFHFFHSFQSTFVFTIGFSLWLFVMVIMEIYCIEIIFVFGKYFRCAMLKYWLNDTWPTINGEK